MRSSLILLVTSGAWLTAVTPSTMAASTGDVLTAIDLGQVEVGGEIGRRIDLTIHSNLLVLDAEKDFLPFFRSKEVHEHYVGLGKLIDSAVRFAAYTNDEKVIALKSRLVAETIETQEPDGYIGVMAPEARMWGLWDLHEMGYIILALTSDHHYFGEQRSLDAAGRVADYILQRWSTMPEGWPTEKGVATNVGVTDLEGNVLSLYRETGNRRYLDFCIQERGLPGWDLGIVIGRRHLIEGHAYSYLARCLAQIELYRLQPQASLLSPTQRAVRFLTAEDGMVITGATGEAEVWTDDQDGRNYLGETCTTTYQLRVYDNLLRLKGESFYGDLMERTIYNALFAAQSPDGRQIRYYTPFEGNRVYWPRDTFCCPNNYRRILADLPTMVYYRSETGLAVNLYTSSNAAIDLDGNVSLKVRQETDYPTSGHIELRLDPSKPARFSLKLRIPRWCADGTVTINGQPWKALITPGTFLEIDREWSAGDQVILDLPMPWRLVLGRKRQSGRAAVMRGPVVFCLNPAQNDSLRDRDGADLGFIMIDPASLKEVPGDTSVRPGGVGCEVRAGDIPSAAGVSGNLLLKLTEFPDPQGKCIYFRLPDLSVAVPDELDASR